MDINPIQHEDKEDELNYYTKVVALSLQFLDKKEKDEPVMALEGDAADYEVSPF